MEKEKFKKDTGLTNGLQISSEELVPWYYS